MLCNDNLFISLAGSSAFNLLDLLAIMGSEKVGCCVGEAGRSRAVEDRFVTDDDADVFRNT